jgi:hypothetical protein
MVNRCKAKYGLIFLFALNFIFASNSSKATTYDWKGVTSDWGVATNWTPAGIPGANDDVRVGVTSYTTPLNVTGTRACYTFTMGVLNPAVTVTGTLNVTNTLTQLPNSVLGAVTSNLNGSGTVNCASLNTGSNAIFLTLTAGANALTFISTVANLNVTDNVNVYSTSFGILFIGVGLNNATFSLRGGTATIGGQIITNNTAGGVLSSVYATPKFSVDVPAGSVLNPTLKLTNPNPINTASVSRSIDFFNNTGGTGIITTEYAGTATQTIYTNLTTTCLDTSATVYQNIAFSGTAAKTIQPGNFVVSGSWTSSGGKVDAVTNEPYIIFNSTSAQTLTDNGSDVVNGTANGIVFKNVLFQGTGVKTISSGKFAVAGNGILYMGSGNTLLNANNHLTLLSTEGSTAGIAPIPAGSSITGSVGAQRFLVGGNTKSLNVYTARGYRILSSPVHLGITSNYDISYIGLTALTGGSGTGFTVNNSNPTIYLFREDVTPSNATFNSGKHKGITSINADNTVNVSGMASPLSIPIGNGYIFYFVGNTSNPSTKASANPTTGPENTIITATGTINQGDIIANLWYTPAGTTGSSANKLSYTSTLGSPTAGYNMMGNPYAATLDLNSLINGNSGATGIANTIYVLDNVNPAQQYIAYSPLGSSSPKATRYVASGQGFIVKAAGPNATLTFRESYKAVSNQPSTLLMGIPVAQAPVTGFYVKMERDSMINDYCGIYFRSGSSANFSADDAKDLDGTGSQIHMSSYTADGMRTAINQMPDYINGSKIRLYVNSAADGLHKLKLEDVKNIDTLYNIWLKDKYKKDSLDIGHFSTYNFNIIRSDTASFGGNRFELVIRRKPLPPYQLIKFTATEVMEGIKINWKTYNEGNYTGFTVEKLETGSSGQYTPIYTIQSSGKTVYSFTDLQPGKGAHTYRLQQNDINNKINWSEPVTIVVGNATTSANLVDIHPNPATAMIKLSVNTETASDNYVAKIYNYMGALVSSQKAEGSSWTQDVTPLQPGTYVYELTKPNGELVGRSKFIKK